MDFEEQIVILKEGGIILTDILKSIKLAAKIGVNASDLNSLAEKLIAEAGAESAFKNYQPEFAKYPYPFALCVSVNEIIVHGFSTDDVIIKDGDVVKLDLGIKYKGFYTDAAITIGAGNISQENKKLISVVKMALQNGIKIAKAGKTFGDIGWVIESTILDAGFMPIKNLCGHDIGEFIHGNLQVLNYGDPGTSGKIKPEMIFTIEPMASISSDFGIQENDYIFRTQDNSVSAHFEATIAILEKETIVLTPIFDVV